MGGFDFVSLSSSSEPWMPSLMLHNCNSNPISRDASKVNYIREAPHQTATHIALDYHPALRRRRQLQNLPFEIRQ